MDDDFCNDVLFQVIVVSVVSVRGEAIQLNLNSYEEYKGEEMLLCMYSRIIIFPP